VAAVTDPGSAGRGGLYRRFLREVAAAKLTSGPETAPPVTEDDMDGLPGAVRRYLRFTGVVGRPRDWSFRTRFQGRFRLKGKMWMPAEAWQYNSALDVARVYVMRLRFASVVPMVGVDTYLRGRGRMIGFDSGSSSSPPLAATSVFSAAPHTLSPEAIGEWRHGTPAEEDLAHPS
jgi:hypothetical protein